MLFAFGLVVLSQAVLQQDLYVLRVEGFCDTDLTEDQCRDAAIIREDSLPVEFLPTAFAPPGCSIHPNTGSLMFNTGTGMYDCSEIQPCLCKYDAPPFDNAGISPDSCGQPRQGLVPVDCTSKGDIEAFCVFGNHCHCGEGYVCGNDPFASECAAGYICLPIETALGDGVSPNSCGQPNQGLVPVDCTAEGDMGSFCIFGNHCHCGEGYECGSPFFGPEHPFPSECAPGSICLPIDVNSSGVFDDLLESDCISLKRWYRANNSWLTWADIQDHLLVHYWIDASMYATLQEAREDFLSHCNSF